VKKKNSCRGLTVKGCRCRHSPTINGYCLHHYSKEMKLSYKKVRDEYGEPNWTCKKGEEEKECLN
jgi:hypothetical protein